MLVLVYVLLSVINNALFKLTFNVRDFNRVIFKPMLTESQIILYRHHPWTMSNQEKQWLARDLCGLRRYRAK